MSFRVRRAVNATCKHHACLRLRAHEQAKILLQCTCEQVVNAWVSKQDISFTKIITRLLFFSHVFNLEKPCALNHKQTTLLMSSLHHRSCSELVRLSIHSSPTKQAGGHKSYSLACKPSYICAVILQVVVAQNQHQRCCLHH